MELKFNLFLYYTAWICWHFNFAINVWDHKLLWYFIFKLWNLYNFCHAGCWHILLWIKKYCVATSLLCCCLSPCCDTLIAGSARSFLQAPLLIHGPGAGLQRDKTLQQDTVRTTNYAVILDSYKLDWNLNKYYVFSCYILISYLFGNMGLINNSTAVLTTWLNQDMMAFAK